MNRAGIRSAKGLLALCSLLFACALGALAQGAGTPLAAPDQREAKKTFGAISAAAGKTPLAIGRYDRGCVAGAQKLPINGPGWQVMRLSRHRMWGHPVLIGYLRTLASDINRLDGWTGLLVGDMAQPIGGPLLGGHSSHQIGLDADLWYKPMPAHTMSAEEREHLAAESMVDAATLTVNRSVWGDAQVKLLRRAASYPEVARIFVHPAVKKALCDAAGNDRAWLRKIRPWWQHNDHFHIRLECPEGSPGCVAQAPIPADDGCGEELDLWFKKLRAVPAKPTKPAKPPKPMLVSDLPKECQLLLAEAEHTANPAGVSAQQ